MKSNNVLYIVNDVFPSWQNKGIFTIMSNNYEVPWDKSQAKFLDWAYHGNRSGDKLLSPLVVSVMNDDGTLPDDAAVTLCGVAFMKYGANWARLFAADTSEYNPIENYSMTESGTDARTTKDKRTAANKDTLTHNTQRSNTASSETSGSETTSNEADATATHMVYGFDSSSGKNSDKDTTTDSASGSRTTTGSNSADSTENVTGTDTTDYTRDESAEGSETTEHTFKRSGNIGVTTSAQMIEQEHKLWADWAIYETIFKNIDDVFTIGIFADKTDELGRYVIVKPYTLPQATAEALGGVKAASATAKQTEVVGIRADGTLVYAAGSGAGAVTSVNGKYGDVTLTTEDLGAVDVDTYNTAIAALNEGVDVTLPAAITQLSNSITEAHYYNADNPPDYPVSSVFGKIGAVAAPLNRILTKSYMVFNNSTPFKAMNGAATMVVDVTNVPINSIIGGYMALSVPFLYMTSRNIMTCKYAEGYNLDTFIYSDTTTFSVVKLQTSSGNSSEYITLIPFSILCDGTFDFVAMSIRADSMTDNSFYGDMFILREGGTT